MFLREHPEYEERYRNALGLLSYLVGVELGTEGKTERAIRCFELGLAHNPDNLSLRANYAISLHALGRVDEALDQYEGMIRDPDIGVSPHIWVLAARLYDKQGNYARAHELMKACEPLLPPEDRALKFLAELEQKVAERAACIFRPIMNTHSGST